jgi:cytoskeletal protein CcmA (bactofilin family)
MDTFSSRSRKLLAIAGLVLLAVLLAVPTAWAFDGRGGDVIVIAADEVVDDDLYVGANEFRLDGTVTGDLIVVGSTIEINGVVEGDLMAAGQSIVINGTVEDDARIAGYALVVGGEVLDDFIAAGFSLENESASGVGGDLLFAGYQALLAGDVTGGAQVAGGAVQIAGAIGRDVYVDVGGIEPGEEMPPGFPFVFMPDMPAVPSVPIGLTIDEGASIGGDLSYTANAQVAVPGGAVAGDIDFSRYVPDVEAKPEVKAPSPAALVLRWFVRQLRRLITLLLVGAAMMWLVPEWTRKVASIVEEQPLPSLGWGVVAIAAFLVGMLVLGMATVTLAVVFGLVTLGELAGRFITLGGIVMGAAGLGFTLTWAYVTKIVVSLLLGQLIFRLFKSPVAEHRWWPVLLGVVIFAIIAAIPLLGWLARLVTVLLGLGAVWLWGRDWLAARRAAPAAAEAEA